MHWARGCLGFGWFWVVYMVLETLELCRPNVMNENLGFKHES